MGKRHSLNFIEITPSELQTYLDKQGSTVAPPECHNPFMRNSSLLQDAESELTSQVTGQLGTFSKQITFGRKSSNLRSFSGISTETQAHINGVEDLEKERQLKAEKVKSLLRAEIFTNKATKDLTILLPPQSSQTRLANESRQLSADSKFDFSLIPKFSPIVKRERRRKRKRNEEQHPKETVKAIQNNACIKESHTPSDGSRQTNSTHARDTPQITKDSNSNNDFATDDASQSKLWHI